MNLKISRILEYIDDINVDDINVDDINVDDTNIPSEILILKQKDLDTFQKPVIELENHYRTYPDNKDVGFYKIALSIRNRIKKQTGLFTLPLDLLDLFFKLDSQIDSDSSTSIDDLYVNTSQDLFNDAQYVIDELLNAIDDYSILLSIPSQV